MAILSFHAGLYLCAVLATALPSPPQPEVFRGRGRRRNSGHLEKAQRALEALELQEPSETSPRRQGPGALHVFWDLDNKRPDDLDSAMATLLNFFPEHSLQSVQLYASHATLRHEDCRHLLERLMSDALEDFLQDFPEHFPYGARFPLSRCPGGSGVELPPLPPVSLLVLPARPQAADFWLVREVAQLVAPLKASEPGTLCIISDDSDFRQVMKDIHNSGWQTAILSEAYGWSLRKRADLWFDWRHFLSAAPEGAPRWHCGDALALPRVDLRPHQKANKELRWARDVMRDRGRLRGTRQKNLDV